MLGLPGGHGRLVNPGVAKVTRESQDRLTIYQRVHKPTARIVTAMLAQNEPHWASPGHATNLKYMTQSGRVPNEQDADMSLRLADDAVAPPPSTAVSKPQSASSRREGETPGSSSSYPPAGKAKKGGGAADIPAPSRMAHVDMMASRDAWNASRPFTGGSASDLDLDNDLMPSRPQSRESLHRPSSRESLGAAPASGRARGSRRKPKPWDEL